MKSLNGVAVVAAWSVMNVLTPAHAQVSDYLPIAIEDCWLERTNCVGCGGISGGDTYPSGSAEYAGIPFVHGTDSCYGFCGAYHPGAQWHMPLSLPRVDYLHLLINAWNEAGCVAGDSIIVQVHSSSGQTVELLLEYGVDVRDHWAYRPCDVINGTTTIPVWSNNDGQVIDKLRIDVSALPDITGLDLIELTQLPRYPILFGVTAEWSADCNGDGIVDYGQILDGTFEDANANGVPDCCEEGVSCDPCPGDVNFDGIVNGADISVTLGFWGLNGKPVAADINGDGIVNGADLALVLGNWGPCP